MKYMINFLLAIILTSIAYFIGGVIFKTELTIFQSFMIGLSVVSLGAITEALHAPIGVIIFVPFPVCRYVFVMVIFTRILTHMVSYLFGYVSYLHNSSYDNELFFQISFFNSCVEIIKMR